MSSYRLRFYAGLAVDSVRSLVSVPLECQRSVAPARESPAGVLRFSVGDRDALLCYNRPSAHGRRVFGGLVPYGELWRLGANEPTVLHLPFAARVAGIRVRKGRLALYAVPEPDSWTLVLNRSTRQWGSTRAELGRDGRTYPSAYTSSVRRAELGRAAVKTEPVSHVEQLTARTEVVDARRTHLVFEWETVRAVVPIEVRR